MPDVADNYARFTGPAGFVPPQNTPGARPGNRTRPGNRGSPATQALITTILLVGLAIVWFIVLYVVFVGRWTPASTDGSRRGVGYAATTAVMIVFTVIVVVAARTRRRAVAAGLTVTVMFAVQRVIAAVLASSYVTVGGSSRGGVVIELHGFATDPNVMFFLSFLAGFLFYFAVIIGWTISRRRSPGSWAGLMIVVPFFLVIEVFSAVSITPLNLNSLPVGPFGYSPWAGSSGIKLPIQSNWLSFVADAVLILVFVTVSLLSIWVVDVLGSSSRRRPTTPTISAAPS
ncbi:hypothetical protein [Gordonia sp. 852002-10350_SCH5691597]|uniref:hypothetical protein n=1 Tax=Gordonia sp. 852002-10350_SCH5691597 TaxID=1834085 RepID=UPI0007EAF841|nr:hypothetical protein [Gordonia sp. 852002-10350_SCH5691597]OBA69525.1 hypothetical protein A5777_14110 [Gordonia sp. 852002-10350_SCH5691597]